jgi:hypothetical protein
MNYDKQICKQTQDQPAYIKCEQLLQMQKSSLVRYERANNTLNLMPLFFEFIKPILKEIDDIMSQYAPLQKIKLQSQSDTENVTLITGMIRSFRALPLMVKQKIQSGLASRTSIVGARTTYDQSYLYIAESVDDFPLKVSEQIITALDAKEFLVIDKYSHGIVILNASIDKETILQDACQYEITFPHAELPPLEELATPGAHTIDDLVNFTKRPPTELVKAVMYQAEGRLIFVNIRGDLEVSEEKLRNSLGISDSETAVELASEELLKKHGLVSGFAGLVNMKRPSDAIIIVDESVRTVHSGVTGANKVDFHFTNFNLPRDTTKIGKFLRYADVAAAPRLVKGSIISSISFINGGEVLGNDSKPIKVKSIKATFRMIDIAASFVGKRKIHGVYIVNTLKTDEKANAAAAALLTKLSPHLVVIDNRGKVNFGAKMEMAKMSFFDNVIVASTKTDDATVGLNDTPTPITALPSFF